MTKVVYYLTPSSFCFGVKRSIDELIKILNNHPDCPIFCIHALVHNPKVTGYFNDRGVSFVESIDDNIPTEAIVVFSAHGINRIVLDEANKRFQKVYNLECPFVSKIYTEAQKYLSDGITDFLYIGKSNHQEGKNITDYIVSKGGNVKVILPEDNLDNFNYKLPFAVLSQTTLNFSNVKSLLDQIQIRFPQALLPQISDVCRATYERQAIIHQHLNDFDTLVVIGGKESSNTQELYKIGTDSGKTSFYAESLSQLLLDPNFINQKNDRVAVTGGASTPVEDILEVLDRYEKHNFTRQTLNLVGRT